MYAGRRILRDGFDYFFCKRLRTWAAFRKPLRKRTGNASFCAIGGQALSFGFGIVGKAIDGGDDGNAKTLQDFYVPAEIGKSPFEVAFALVLHASDCSDKNGGG